MDTEVPAYVSQDRFYGPKSSDNNDKACNELSLQLTLDEVKSKAIHLYNWQKKRIGRVGIDEAKAIMAGKDAEAVHKLVDLVWPWSGEEKKNAAEYALLRGRLHKYLNKDQDVVLLDIQKADEWASSAAGLKYADPETFSASPPPAPSTPAPPSASKKKRPPPPPPPTPTLSPSPAKIQLPSAKQRGKKAAYAVQENGEELEHEPAAALQGELSKEEDNDASSCASKEEPDCDAGEVPDITYSVLHGMDKNSPPQASESRPKYRRQHIATRSMSRQEPASSAKSGGTSRNKDAFDLAGLRSVLSSSTRSPSGSAATTPARPTPKPSPQTSQRSPQSPSGIEAFGTHGLKLNLAVIHGGDQESDSESDQSPVGRHNRWKM
ncbi:hypothetical protein AC578_4218 [Pseudocercospora eumusae]|uniref:Uncharacterized protein n=1 Tax=Pseudocercospora eumusae TaxID=321146 RepID=A0A139H387_9PEZI|nr:hypothetical protein AC578_4218 [Pseudocercospora eumusae]